MKKILFALIVLGISIHSINAQTEKGKYFLGISSVMGLNGIGNNLMTLGYTKTKYDRSDDESSTIGFNLSPKVGLFVADNFALGSDITCAIASSENSSNSETTNKLFMLSPFFRYYFPKSKVSPYFEANGSVGSSSVNYESDFGDDSHSSDILGLGLGIGFNAFLSEKSSIDLSFAYNYYDVDHSSIHMIGLKVGFMIFLGDN